MNAKVLSFIVAAVAYGITLTIAALLLPNMHVGFWWALIAWALFTLSITLLRPVLARSFGSRVHGYTWVVGLVTVLLSLIITVLLSPSSGFSIRGFWTWVLATLIVWIGTVVYDMVDDRLLAAAQGRPAPSAPESSADRPPYNPPTPPGGAPGGASGQPGAPPGW